MTLFQWGIVIIELMLMTIVITALCQTINGLIKGELKFTRDKRKGDGSRR